MDNVYTVPLKVMTHTKVKELQYKILNKYLATNSFFKKIGLTENRQSTFCEQNTICSRLLYECSNINKFWCNFCFWWLQCLSQQFLLTYKDILIGYSFQDTPTLLNAWTLCAKYFYIQMSRTIVDTPVLQLPILPPPPA